MKSEAKERVMSIMKRTREDRFEYICIFLFVINSIPSLDGLDLRTFVQHAGLRQYVMASLNL